VSTASPTQQGLKIEETKLFIGGDFVDAARRRRCQE
jgi:hypothetical protein